MKKRRLPYNYALLLFCAFMLCISGNLKAQEQKKAKPANAVSANFTSFSAAQQHLSAEAVKNNSEYAANPELGLLFPDAPCENCYELIGKRTAVSKTFVKEGTNGQDILVQSYTDPVHYHDKDGQWRTISQQLHPDANSRGVYAATDRPSPVSINTQQGFTSIGQAGSQIAYNRDLELVYIAPDGIERSLGFADWTHNTAGDNGVYVTNVWAGIDLEIYVMRIGIKTNFFITHALPEYAAGRLVIRDHMHLDDGLTLSAPLKKQYAGDIEIKNAAGVKLYDMARALAYIKTDSSHKPILLNYKLQDQDVLDIEIPGSFTNREAAAYPIVIDPLVTGTNSVTVPGSTYSPGWAIGCQSVNTVTVPAGVTITNITFNFSYGSNVFYLFGLFNDLSDAGFWLNLGTCQTPPPGLAYSCADAFLFATICTATNYSMLPDVTGCIPAPQCTAYPLPVTLNFSQQYEATAACSPVDFYAASQFSVTVSGHTSETGSTSNSAGAATVCANSSVTLSATGQYGVPPYNYQWNPGALPGSPVTVNPAVTTTYTVTVTDQCNHTSTGTTTVNIGAGFTIGSTSSTNPTTCISNDGTITFNGVTANTSYTVNYTQDGTPQTQTIVSNAAGVVVLTNLPPGAYTALSLALASGCTSNVIVGPINLANPVTLATPTASNNGPVCEGGTIILSTTPATGVIIMWTGPNGFTGSTSPININGITPAFAGNFCVKDSLAGCVSPTVCTGVVVNPTPVISGATFTNPTTCLGSDGTITLTGLTTGTSYTVNYNQSATPVTTTIVAVAPGNVVITGLPAGTYSSFSVSAATCPSAAFGGAVVLSNPEVGITVTPTNPTACGGSDGSLLIQGGPNNPSYTVYYTQDGVPNIVPASSAPSGDVTISGLPAGTYTQIWVYVQGSACVSDTLGPITIANPPAPPITGSSSTNPTTCLGTDGTITLTGQTTGSSYTVTYLQNGVSQSATIVATAPGNVVITGLPAGTYTNFSVAQGVCSATLAGPVTLTDPPPPATPTAGSNTPVCSGSPLNLTGTDATPGVTYNWAGPSSYSAPNTQNPTILLPTTAASGTYTLTVTVNNCNAPATTVVVVNPAPVISTTSFTNPTTCLGTDGTITLSGLTAGVSYDINYSKNSTAQAMVTLLAGAGGAVVITNLSSGNYTGFTVTSLGCTSPSVAGPIALVDPTAPAIPVAGSNSPLCEGSDIDLTATDVTAGTITYNWSGPSFSSAGQNPIITGATTAYSGVYTVTATQANCTSNPATTTVVVNIIPAIPTAGSNTPVCTGTALNLTATDVTPGAVTYNWTGPNSFAIVSANPSISNATMPDAGTYSVTASLNGCTSTQTTTAVVVDSTPTVASTSFTDPTTCGGSDGTITLTGLEYSTSFGVAYNQNGVAQSATITSDAAGNIVINGLQAGTYTGIVLTATPCASSPAGPISLSDPTPPATPVAGSSTPVCTDSTLTLTATDATGGVSYNWSGPNGFGSALQNPTITGATTLAAGVYTVTATLNSCTSAQATTTVVVDVTPVISGTTFTNPTTCLGADGSITFDGLVAGITYTINYTQNGTPLNTTAVADPSGDATLMGLTEGAYTDLSVALPSGCPSDTTAPVTLTDPLPPAVPVAGSNTPLCTGNTLNLTGSDVTPGTITYNWTGPNSYSANIASPTITNIILMNAGVYTLTATQNNCTSAPATTTVVIDSTAIITIVSSAGPTTCLGSDGKIVLGGLVPGITYTIDYSNGTAQSAPLIADASGDVTISGLPSGTYSNMTATITGSCPSAAVGPVVLTDPALPATPSASGNTPVCTSGSIALTATDVTTGTLAYNWQGPNSFASSAQNPTLTNVTLVAGGVYTVTATQFNCTSLPGTVTIVVDTTPHITGISSTNPTTCQGVDGTITLTGLTIGTSYTVNYTKDGNPLSATIVAIAPGQVVLTGGGGTYNNFSVTSLACSSNTVGPVVLVDPAAPSNPVAGSNTPVCSSDAINLTATSTAGATFSWSGPNSFTSNAQNPIINNAQTVASGVYTVIATLNNCPSLANGFTTVLVNQTPAAPIVSNVTFCQFDNPAPLTAVGTSLLWYTTPSGGIGNPTAPLPPTATPGTTTWFVSQSATSCEGPRAPISVTINAKPAAPAAVPSFRYCQGEVAAKLDAAGTNLLWYTNAAGGTSSPNAPTPPTDVPGETTWYVTETVNGCESDRTAIKVTVIPKPQPPVVAANEVYCQHDDVQALVAQGQNMLWYDVATGGVGSALAPIPVTSVPNVTTWYVSQVVNGCTSDRVPTTVTVYFKPEVAINPGKGFACQFDTLELAFSGPAIPGGGFFNWSLPSGAFVVNGSLTSDSLRAEFDLAGDYTVTLTATDQSGTCSTSASYVVPVSQQPTVSFLSKQDVCEGDTLTVALTTVTSNVTKYNWDFDGGDIVKQQQDGAGPYEVIWGSPGVHTIQLVAQTAQACSTKVMTQDINIHELPDAHIGSVSATSICLGDSVEFKATTYLSNYSYQWSPVGYFHNSNSEEIWGVIHNPGNIVLTVTSEFGCVSKDSVFIDGQPCCQVLFPNAFTPNGDANNDIFRPITLGNHQLHIFQVANRWGQVVFSTSNEHLGWNGTLNGVPQDIGTYFWYIKYDCNGGTTEEKGEVVLIR